MRMLQGRVQRAQVALCTLLIFQEYHIKLQVIWFPKRSGEIFGLIV
jgi:hypothetical protein